MLAVGSNNWELERDLSLARQGLSVYAGVVPGPADVARLEAALKAFQEACVHFRNPEKSEQCLLCSALIEDRSKKIEERAERPPLAKARQRTFESGVGTLKKVAGQ